MAVDMFLFLEGIPGEAHDKVHEGEIDVLAWSWGASQSGSMHVGGGGGSGKASFQDLAVTKWVDKSTTALLQYCSDGSHIPKAKLVVRKAGKTPLEYIVIDFEDLIVSSISTGGSGGEDRLTENVTLNFRTFKMSYVEQKEDGTAEPEVTAGWDIARNVTLV